MKTAKFIILWGLGSVAWGAPTVGSGLTKSGDSGSVAAVMMGHGKEVGDDVIYKDYKRASQPEGNDDKDVYTGYKRVVDKDAIYTDYKRADDKDATYTDYKIASQPEENDDKDGIYTDYKRTGNDKDTLYSDY